jgi:sec-independent protein translocase protein TatC
VTDPEPRADERALAKRPEGTTALAERSPDGPPGEIEKPFMDHLMELRSRIIITLLVLVLSMVAALVFYKQVSQVLMQPMHDYNDSLEAAAKLKMAAKLEEAAKLEGAAKVEAVAKIEAAAKVDVAGKVDVFTMRPTEGFVAVLKLGLWGGLILAFPMIAWQVWRFVSPGLYRREKLAILPILTLGAFCFAGGVYFAYTFVLPPALNYLMQWAPELGVKASVTLEYYLQFMVMVHVAFGIAFETPLVILALARLGLVTAGGLARKWQYMIVAAFVLGAFLTPPDIVTQLMMAGSLVTLYTLSIILALLFGKRTPLEDAEGVEGDESSSWDSVRGHGGGEGDSPST